MTNPQKNTRPTLMKKMADGVPITMITCYDYAMADLLDKVGHGVVVACDHGDGDAVRHLLHQRWPCVFLWVGHECLLISTAARIAQLRFHLPRPSHYKRRDAQHDGDQPDEDQDVSGDVRPRPAILGYLDDGAEHVVSRKELRDPLRNLRDEVDQGWRVQDDAGALDRREQRVDVLHERDKHDAEYSGNDRPQRQHPDQ